MATGFPVHLVFDLPHLPVIRAPVTVARLTLVTHTVSWTLEQLFSSVEDDRQLPLLLSSSPSVLCYRTLATGCPVREESELHNNIHSLEPEDLRAITVATARDTGIPLAGMQQGQVV